MKKERQASVNKKPQRPKSKNSTRKVLPDTIKTCFVHIYSKGIPLAEAVIVAGQPSFIRMTGGVDFVLSSFFKTYGHSCEGLSTMTTRV